MPLASAFGADTVINAAATFQLIAWEQHVSGRFGVLGIKSRLGDYDERLDRIDRSLAG